MCSVFLNPCAVLAILSDLFQIEFGIVRVFGNRHNSRVVEKRSETSKRVQQGWRSGATEFA